MAQRRLLHPWFLTPLLLSLVAVGPEAEASGKKKRQKQRAKKIAAQAGAEAPRPGPQPKRPAPAEPAGTSPPAAGEPKAGAGVSQAKPHPGKPAAPKRAAAGARPPATETKAAGGPAHPLTAAVMDGFKDLPPEQVLALLEAASRKIPLAPLGKAAKKAEKALTARLLLAPPDPEAATAVAELRHKLLAGQAVNDFTRLDLRGSNLDLTRRDLDRANFYRARLGSVDFLGASVRDACFFRADLRGVKNLDLTGAQLHPFFQQNAGEPIGTIRTVRLPGLGPAAADQQDRILLTRDRCLVWIRDDGPGLRVMAPTGWSYDLGFESGLRVLAIKEDPAGRLYLFTDQGLHFLQPGQLLKGEPETTQVIRDLQLTAPPRGVGFNTRGQAMFFADGKAHVVDPEARTHTAAATEPLGIEDAQVRLVAFRFPMLLLRDRRPDMLLATDLSQGLTYHLYLSGGLQDLAAGPDHTFFGTLQADGCLARLTVEPGGEDEPPRLGAEPIPLAFLASGTRRPYGIARGEDGNFWFTDPGAQCVGRLTPEGEVVDFPLRPGQRPLRIFPSGDGCMLVTLEGQDRLLRIRTVAVPGTAPAPGILLEDEEKGEAAEETKASAFAAIHQEDFQETEADAEAETPEGKGEAPAAPAEPIPEGKAAVPTGWTPPAPDPRRGTARRRLHERGYHLDENLAALILSKHRFKEDSAPGPVETAPGPAEFRLFRGKSQFSAGVKSVADLAEFLAQGLAGEVTCEESDFPGREYWTFTLPEAGRVHAMNAYGSWRSSDKVLVITRQTPGPRGTSRKVIINAFPLRR